MPDVQSIGRISERMGCKQSALLSQIMQICPILCWGLKKIISFRPFTFIIIYIAFYSKTWFLSIIYIIIYIIIYLHQYLHHILQQNLSFKFTWFFTLISYCNSRCLFNSIYTSKFTYNPKMINRKNGCMLVEEFHV